MKDLETKLFVESHTKEILTEEKVDLTKELNSVKANNQNMGRAITKDKYHNNRDDLNKQRRKDIESTKDQIMQVSDLVESELSSLQKELERNADPNLFKRQNDVTINL